LPFLFLPYIFLILRPPACSGRTESELFGVGVARRVQIYLLFFHLPVFLSVQITILRFVFRLSSRRRHRAGCAVGATLVSVIIAPVFALPFIVPRLAVVVFVTVRLPLSLAIGAGLQPRDKNHSSGNKHSNKRSGINHHGRPFFSFR